MAVAAPPIGGIRPSVEAVLTEKPGHSPPYKAGAGLYVLAACAHSATRGAATRRGMLEGTVRKALAVSGRPGIWVRGARSSLETPATLNRTKTPRRMEGRCADGAQFDAGPRELRANLAPRIECAL